MSNINPVMQDILNSWIPPRPTRATVWAKMHTMAILKKRGSKLKRFILKRLDIALKEEGPNPVMKVLVSIKEKGAKKC